MFNKILIANRGEIACRIIRTAHQLGIETATVYSAADRESVAVLQADAAFYIGEAKASLSYLNINAIIEAALKFGAEAIHPGYGFLSENPDLAEACAEAGLIFIGPPVAAIKAMASKQLAKQMLEKTAVPLTPGYHGNEQSDERLLQEAKKIGFPILLKAAAGGGGKGMRAVFEEQDFFQALAGARREAKSSFADETMLIEKLLQRPRHVEVQIMADNHGQIVHLFERDCSIQRRHQKIIEEAPAPSLSNTLRQGLAEAAIAVARAIEYRGAGTVEFLVDEQENFYFMEMNTRLQVEHPVTEMITRLDLVEWQLRIAAGEPLPCTQEHIKAEGHAIECRIYAEDPAQNFMPSIGQILFLQEPKGTGIRIDSGVKINTQITMYYDPMIAKLIAWGEDRTQALQRLLYALKHYHIGGVKTNIPFLQAILEHPQFKNEKMSTNFLDQETLVLPNLDKQLLLSLAASVDYLKSLPSPEDGLQADTFAWQMHLQSSWHLKYTIAEEDCEVIITPLTCEEFILQRNNHKEKWRIKRIGNQLYFDNGKQKQHIYFEDNADELVFYLETGPASVKRFNWQTKTAVEEKTNGRLTAPMPATVVAILKNKGDKIKAGERLVVLEAMKMEHTIHAPEDGRLADVFYEIGAQVHEGAALVALDTDIEQ